MIKKLSLITIGFIVPMSLFSPLALTTLAQDSILVPPDPAPAEMFDEVVQEEEQSSGTLLMPYLYIGTTNGTWVAQGPGPTQNGQVENINPDDEVVGAVHTVVTDPSDPNILFVGAVNGGIWQSTNATASSPNWQPLTDDFPSLSIGALEMDPADPNILLAGIGRFSSFARRGGKLTGLLLSMDSGNNWVQIMDPLLLGENTSGVAARGSTLLAASNGGVGVGRLVRSIDTGASWTQISGAVGSGLPLEDVFDLVGDPSNTSRFYVALRGVGIFRSDDTGTTWTNISQNDPTGVEAVITGGGNNNTEMAVASNGRLYAAVLINGQARYIGFSDDLGLTWTAMDLPQEIRGGTITNATNAAPIVITSNLHRLRNNDQVTIIGVLGNTAANGTFNITTFNTGNLVIDLNQFSLNGSVGNGVYGGGGAWTHVDGINPVEKPGGQGAIHFSMVVDPTNPNMVYVGGDRQDSPFPNSIGASDFSGSLYRGDTAIAPTGAVPSPQWEHLTHSDNVAATPGGGTVNSSAPHADSREMVFDAMGDIIEVDDGGIYRRTNPQDNTGDWFSINGDIQTTEFHDIAYDSNSNIIIGGAQDTGTPEQLTTGGTTWNSVSKADGGDVAVDDTSMAGQSIRYSSNQFLGRFRRRTCDAANSCGTVTSIMRTVIAGNPLQTQFVTPIELNEVDQTFLIIGGSNSVYESPDMGDNISEITGPGANRNAMVYGHPNNISIIYIGSGTQVFVRTTAGGNLVATPTAFPGGVVRDIVLDSADEDVAYVIDSDQVFQTTDAGTTWTDITGDIAVDGAENFRTIEYVERATNDLIVVGTNAGLLVSVEGSFGTWFNLGSGLPNAPVWDLDFDATDDVLVAGTLGRGAWTLADVTTLNVPPVALCMNTTVPTEPGVCVANASVDNGSFDPDGDPITLTQAPPGPYPLGMTNVMLSVVDDQGASDSCSAKVTVVDQEPPMIVCNAPLTIIPPDAPISFTASATDNCLAETGVTTVVTGFDCFQIKKNGKVIDKTESCEIFFAGDTITILNSGGVNDTITWNVTATDGSGNQTDEVCEVEVVNPGNKP